MRQKKNVSPSAATLGETAKTEATFEQATISKNNYTTNYNQRQTGEISQLLLCGVENAITRRDLMALTRYSDRTLRLLIEAERRQSIPILSDNQHGCFMPKNQEGVDHCVRSLRSRAAEIEVTAAAIEKVVLPE